jgi:hypothetical protein
VTVSNKYTPDRAVAVAAVYYLLNKNKYSVVEIEKCTSPQ